MCVCVDVLRCLVSLAHILGETYARDPPAACMPMQDSSPRASHPHQRDAFTRPPRNRDSSVYDTDPLQQEGQAVAKVTEHAASMQHLGQPCQNMPNASTEPYGWMLPKDYGRPSQHPQAASLPGGALGPPAGAEMYPTPDLNGSVMDWQSLDVGGGQAPSMSCKLNIEPEHYHRPSPLASACTAPGHRSVSSSHIGGDSMWLKQEPEMELEDFDAGTDSALTTNEPRVRMHHL